MNNNSIKEKILIVEDERRIGSLLGCLLENDGFEVLHAANGRGGAHVHHLALSGCDRAGSGIAGYRRQ